MAKPKKYPSSTTPRAERVSEPHTVNIYEAKTRLSELVDRASSGETIVIAKAGTPVARLMPLPPAPPERTPGLLKGQIWVSDDFDDPLPPDIQRFFDDPVIFPPDVDEGPHG